MTGIVDHRWDGPVHQLDDVVATLLAQPVEGHLPPGAALLVWEDGEVSGGAAGVADLDSGEPMTLTHAHDLASVSKVLTTLTALILISRGELTPHTTVAQVLGPRRAGDLAGRTLEQLVRHRAGVTPWYPLYLRPDAAADPLSAALGRPPAFPPDQGWHYSDLGLIIVGGMISAVTGTSLADAVSQLLLAPLGVRTVTPGGTVLPAVSGPDGDAIEYQMVVTGVPYPVDADPASFTGWRSHTLRGEIADGNAFHAFHGVAGHAGWFADPAGLLSIAQAIATPERHRLWGPAESALLASAGPDDAQAFGLRRYRSVWDGRSREFLGHPGFTGCFVATSPATAPGERALAVVLATNRLHGRPAPGRGQLVNVEHLWRRALELADRRLHSASRASEPSLPAQQTPSSGPKSPSSRQEPPSSALHPPIGGLS